MDLRCQQDLKREFRGSKFYLLHRKGGLKCVGFRPHVILLYSHIRNGTVRNEDLMPTTVAASGTNYWTKLLKDSSIGIPGLPLL
ncbi:hypothetical protein N7G274_001256 [Stereocaulon virgatum]|uniref:Uncharacterized protein n=1 Tax=Stereocaulon virgatum TaxID=373712 RepID=A0ABR4AR13_9LECA